MKSFDDLTFELPLGIQTFKTIRAAGKIYVDKTELVYDLLICDWPLLFTRPRSFGKSTLVSVLKELFNHGVEPYDGHDSYFKGLAIERLWHEVPYNDGPFNVMHLDFSDTLIGCSSLDDFKRKLCGEFMGYARKFGVELTCADPLHAAALFGKLLSKLPDYSVVLLIDAYDALLTEHINDDGDKDFKAAARILSDLFTLIKCHSGKFRFTFCTGVTRYHSAVIFGEGNIVSDISYDPRYGTLCGFTRDEIRQYFPEHLVYAAAQVFHKDKASVTEEDKERLLDQMQQWYGGCCFDDGCSTQVFSTWSVLNFFANSHSDFDTYWFESGGVPPILRRLLFENTVYTLENAAAEDFSVGEFAFSYPQSLASMARSVLLFQTGYLTIKAPYSGLDVLSNVRLGLPNQELKTALYDVICSEICARPSMDIVLQTIRILERAVRKQDLEELKECFNKLLLILDEERILSQGERMLSACLKFFIHLALRVPVLSKLFRYREQGGAALLFSLEDLSVVIELGFAQDNSEPALENKLEEAAAQVKKFRYEDVQEKRPKLWRLAMVFSSVDRMITHAAVVER